MEAGFTLKYSIFRFVAQNDLKYNHVRKRYSIVKNLFVKEKLPSLVNLRATEQVQILCAKSRNAALLNNLVHLKAQLGREMLWHITGFKIRTLLRRKIALMHN